MGELLAFHTLVSYLLTGQPLHRTLHLAISPHTADQPEGAFHWACLTLGMLLLAFLVANVIPFFADVQDLLGNILRAPTVFGWPAFFFLRGSALRGRPAAKTRAHSALSQWRRVSKDERRRASHARSVGSMGKPTRIADFFRPAGAPRAN